MASKTYVLKGNLSHGTYALPTGKAVALDADGDYSTADVDEQRALEDDPNSPFKLADKASKKKDDG